MMVIAVDLLIVMGFIFFTLTGFADTKRHTYIEPEKMALLGAIKASNIQEAEKILTDYLATNPEYISEILYNELGHVYIAQKKYAEALNILEKGHEAYPENEGINIKMMICYAEKAQNNNEFIESGRLYEKIYDNFHDRHGLSEAAASYIRAGDMSEATRVYYRMADLLIDPDELWLETLIRTANMLGIEDEAKDYKKQLYRKSLREKDVCYDLLTSDDSKGIHIYRLWEVDVPPTIIKWAPRQYPAKALEERITGKVKLCYVVTKEGTVGDVLIEKSEPKDIFDESALEYIKQYLFKPAIKDGKPVDVLIHDLVKFNLK